MSIPEQIARQALTLCFFLLPALIPAVFVLVIDFMEFVSNSRATPRTPEAKNEGASRHEE